MMWFIWVLGLVLFDSHKDAFSGKKTLVFGNILGFLGVHWVQKWTKTINFGYVLFPLKHSILKDCSETVFVLRVIITGEKAQNRGQSKVHPLMQMAKSHFLPMKC